jgi:hypothetical protein
MDDHISTEQAEPDPERRVYVPGDAGHMPNSGIIRGRGRVGKSILSSLLGDFSAQPEESEHG